MRLCLLFVLVALGVGASARSIAAEEAKTSPKSRSASPANPIVAGFERFSTTTGHGDQPLDAAGLGRVGLGRLLLGELNCTSCHEPGAATVAVILPKQAPVLSEVGARVKPEWLRELLNNPRHAKPGTTMPDVLAGLRPEERTQQVESLVHYLASLGGRLPIDLAPDKTAAGRGETLFHEIGCVACHGAQGDSKPVLNTSVPLGRPWEKYSIASLAKFLREPLKVRPSGRMPHLNITDQEGYDLAHYFLRSVAGNPANLNYAYFEGDFKTLAELAPKRPKSTGTALGFDLGVAKKSAAFGLTFTGFLRIAEAAEYTFYLTSDDGSRLSIDGLMVVENDGVHARTTKTGEMTLDRGMHALTVDYFNVNAEAVLDIEIEGPTLARGDITQYVSITEDAAPPVSNQAFKIDEKLVAEGRTLFATAGCASCHEVREEKGKPPVASKLSGMSKLKLADLNLNAGCLSDAPSGRAAQFHLSKLQREALRQALSTKPQSASDREKRQAEIVRHMTTFNCYACHARDNIGGVEAARDDHFATTIKEMGEEGRLPPPLNGVGGKLSMSWMRNIVDKGAKSRPYMLTRMPVFGIRNVKPLLETFEVVDQLPPKPLSQFDEPPYRVKDYGRLLVGSKGFGCIKCHTFDKFKAEGIQSIDMTTMTRRLRPEWFVRYVRDPLTFRPGTRMPSAWPKKGKSYLPTVFDGDCDKQISSVWTYLLDGPKAAPPQGVGGTPVELVATTEAVIYRNFIENAGSRAIGVGYPAKVNLAFDANDFRLASIWKGSFIDASTHWGGRGGGIQPPLGDHVIPLTQGISIAKLKSPDAKWPNQHGRDLGYQFLGYRLDKSQQPTFLYTVEGVSIEDFAEPIVGGTSPQLRRTLSFDGQQPKPGLWFRAAAGAQIEPLADGWYHVDRGWKLRLEAGGATPIIRGSEKNNELLVPVEFKGGKGQIVETFDW
jgi:mono/diheme cytochrome c family protein